MTGAGLNRVNCLEPGADLPRRRTVLPQGHDGGGPPHVERARLAMRTGRGVFELDITEAGAAAPLRHRADADPGGRRGRRLRPALALHPVYQQLPHLGTRLGVTMKSHSGVPPETVGWCGNPHCFQRLPNEQRS